MANNITTMTHYVPILDEKYQKTSLTSILDTDPALIKVEGKDLKFPIMETSGLRNHSRADGGQYKKGKASLRYQTKTPNYDRNTKFGIDSMDDFETQEVAYGMLAGHFIDHEVVPEVDAFRIAKYIGFTKLSRNQELADITTGAHVIAELKKARDYFDDRMVPESQRVLFIRPAFVNVVENLSTQESRAALESFGTVIKMPTDRFYQSITLKDDEDGGYTGSGAVNFVAIHKDAVLQGIKHVAPKFIPAEVNQTADGDEFAYRIYGIVEAFDNKKVEGIYVNLPKGSNSKVKVDFETDSGLPEPADQMIWKGGYPSKPAIDPVKEGYTFKGWFTASTGGTEWDFETKTVSVATTIYAQWEQDAA